MTKEEILHEEAIESCENPTGKIAVYSAMDRYADQQTASLREQLEALKKENEWISVEDELPDYDEPVLVYVPEMDEYKVWMAQLVKDGKEKGWIICPSDIAVKFRMITHWKIPQPPK